MAAVTRKAFLAKLGEWIKRERQSRGLTGEQLAGFVGASQTAVSNWERGVFMPCAYSHMRLRECFRSIKPGDPAEKSSTPPKMPAWMEGRVGMRGL